VGEPDLSQAEQASKGGEPTVDRGNPFGLLGYDCRRLKLERVRSKAGVLSGPILDPCSQEPHQKEQKGLMNGDSRIRDEPGDIFCVKTGTSLRDELPPRADGRRPDSRLAVGASL